MDQHRKAPAFSQLTLVLDRFDAAWQTHQPPRLAEFLAGAETPAARRELLLELIPIDLEYRWRKYGARQANPRVSGGSDDVAGLPPAPSLQHYVDRLPDFGPLENLPPALFVAEYRVRRQWGGWNGPNDFEAVYPAHTSVRPLLVELDLNLTREEPEPIRVKSIPSQKNVDQPRSFPSEPAGPVKSADEASSAIPQTIGRYRVDKILGKGGFGLVYLAHDDQLDRFVAVKVPHRHRVNKSEDAAAYLAEARTVANLDHPNIVPVHDVGSTEAYPCYVVSKYINGTDLTARLDHARPSLHDAVKLVATVAEALHHAHKQGLVHRDIKPGNILLDTSGKPFVTDFGLALREQDMGKGPRYAGTPAYMSPEQARGEGHRVDGRSDIFSLGIVFYELLVGRRPFLGTSQDELLEQIASVEPRPPRQIDDQVPKELERICLKALAKRASDRYTTAKDMAEDLRHFGASSPPEADSFAKSSKLAALGSLSKQIGTSDQRAKVGRSTFFFADFKGFTERVRILEKTAGHQAAAEMKRKVAEYIDEAFRRLEAEIRPSDYQLIDTAGDGFFFHFRQAKDAFRFAEALNKITTAHNAHVTDEIAEHWFRVGAATGDVAWDEGKPVGHIVNMGARLQSASRGGDLVIDQATYDGLPHEWRQLFGPKEIISDKHDKTYEVYRTAFGRPLSPLPDTSTKETVKFSTTSGSDNRPIKIVPKGLRSFDEHDADFFLELLPGPRDRDGLPDSIRFWKTRIEEMDADKTFSVGLIYGPSGCGKSSLVKAGLVPRLNDSVVAVYVEATAEETEARLLNGLRKGCPELPATLSLKETIAALRQGRGLRAGKKVVIILDQLEQWLHAKKDEQNTELVQALRQCDGSRVQCVVMVRDDFWLAVSRFLRELEVRLVEGQNSSLTDLFDEGHARKVLAAFGRAAGKLPERIGKTTKDQKEFLNQAVSGLAQEGKIISVRLALFAEMVKGKTWTPATLKEVGGTEGVGVTFLEETFSATTAPPEHRYHQKAARSVLKALLPNSGTNMKGHMRSHVELLEASGYANRPKDFDDLIHILDNEIRLITPTDPEGKDETEVAQTEFQASQKYYQLTHDYLVPSLREWLTRKQKESRRGRAQLLLEDRAAVWNSRPENRQLPSLWQWLGIRSLTVKSKWTLPQRKMMKRARFYHAVRVAAVVLLLTVTTITGVAIRENAMEREKRNHAASLVRQVLNDDISLAPRTIKEMDGYRNWTDPLLHEKMESAADDPRIQLRSRLALLPVDSGQVEYLYERLLKGEPQDVKVIREALSDHQADLTEKLWHVLENPKNNQDQRLRAACALSAYSPDDSRWEKIKGDVAATLVVQKPFVIAQWADALKNAGRWLIPPLADFLVDEQRSVSERGMIATIYGSYAAGAPDAYTRLETQLAESSKPNSSIEDKVFLAKRKASIGVALLIMGRGGKAWELLKHQPDPTMRSHLIGRLGPGGVDSKVLLDALQEQTEVSVKRAILLSLGEFGLDRFSLAERRNNLPVLLELYEKNTDPGIHGAAEWLLRKWGQATRLREIDDKLRRQGGQTDEVLLARLTAMQDSRLAKVAQQIAERKAAWERQLRDHSTELPSSLSDGLVAHYPLDEASASETPDSVTSRPAATYQGNGKLEWSEGAIGPALRLDGNGTMVAGKPLDVEYDKPFSYGCWFQYNGKVPMILLSTRDSAKGFRGFDLSLENDHQLRMQIAGEGPDLPEEEKKKQYYNGYAQHFISVMATTSVNPQSRPGWHHAFVTYDGSQKAGGVKIYLDGRAQATKVLEDKFAGSMKAAAPLYLGSRHNTYRFQGQLDDVRVYKRVLAETEVRQLFDAGRMSIAKLASHQRTREQQSLLDYEWGEQDEQLTALREGLRAAQQSLTKRVLPRGWYVNSQGQTMMIVSGPDDLALGEQPLEQRKELNRRVAIAANEVTVKQFLAIRPDHVYDQAYAPTTDCPVNKVSWYDAAAYCNELSKKEEIPRDQWCYEPNPDGEYKQGMKMASNFLQRRGYRLPTDSEWEYACRAGANTDYTFGESVQLLDRYAWFDANSLGTSQSAGSLRPNDFGLFDMHGNIWEWCQNAVDGSDPKPGTSRSRQFFNTNLKAATESSEDIDHEKDRVVRGGSFDDPPSSVRSSLRSSNKPEQTAFSLGFRVARTLPLGTFPSLPPAPDGGRN